MLAAVFSALHLLALAVLTRINDIEVALVVLMVFVAAMMARGLWLLP